MNTKLQRIIGLETEFGTYPYSAIPEFGEHWGIEGGRLYGDSGDHPEYATPECRKGWDAAIYDRVGEILAAKRLGQIAPGSPPRLVKNNTAGGHPTANVAEPITWGSHENYLLPSSVGNDEVYHALGAFLVTRIIWTGAGGVFNGNYRISQRSHFIRNNMNADTLRGDRAIVNSRDQHHAAKNWRRQHLIIGEANILFWPSALKLEITSLLMAILAKGELRGLRLDAPVLALHRLSDDWESGMHLLGGKRTSAIRVQRHYLRQAQRFCRRYRISHFDWCLNEWHYILDRLEERDLQALAGRVDWATKRLLIERRTKDLGGDEASAIDLSYHIISGNDGIAKQVRRKFDPSGIESATKSRARLAPSTRAKQRVRLQRAVRRAGGEITSLDWARIDYSLTDSRVVHMRNPLASKDPSIERIIKELSGHGWSRH